MRKLNELIIFNAENFCRNKGLNCLVSKNAVLYCKDCIDYTDEFIKYFEWNR
jgi:hypothetical protein